MVGSDVGACTYDLHSGDTSFPQLLHIFPLMRLTSLRSSVPTSSYPSFCFVEYDNFHPSFCHYLPFLPPSLHMTTCSPDNVHGVFPPPPGVEPNFTNPIYRSAGIVLLTAIFVPLSTSFLAIRIYTKVHIIKVFGLEDCQYSEKNQLRENWTYLAQIKSPWHGYKHLLILPGRLTCPNVNAQLFNIAICMICLGEQWRQLLSSPNPCLQFTPVQQKYSNGILIWNITESKFMIYSRVRQSSPIQCA